MILNTQVDEMVRNPKQYRIGDNVKVIYVGGDTKFFTITAIDDIHYKDSHSALAASGTESYANVTNLDPPSGQLYWFYSITTKSNVQIYIKQPAATNRFGTNKSPEGGILSDIILGDLEGWEFDIWVAEDFPPAAQLINNTIVSITPILYWNGKRFGVQEIRDGIPKMYTTVRIGGLSE